MLSNVRFFIWLGLAVLVVVAIDAGSDESYSPRADAQSPIGDDEKVLPGDDVDEQSGQVVPDSGLKPDRGNLDSILNLVVDEFEESDGEGDGQQGGVVGASGSQDSAERDAASKAPVHSDGAVAVTFYTDGTTQTRSLEYYLQGYGVYARNSGDDYVEAYVPVSLLSDASERSEVLRARAIIPPRGDLGSTVSQGVTVHNAVAWHNAGYTGSGIKVGVIDEGFDGFSGLQGSELPSSVTARCYTEVGVYTSSISDCENDENHGTAVTESLVDVAPQVTLYIANPVSAGDLKSTVDWMVSEGVDVINQSLSWTFDGPGDGTSSYSNSPLKSLDTAVSGGAVWVNSAGNYASSTWYGTLNESPSDSDTWHEFEGGDECNSIAVGTDEEVQLQLRWDDTWDGAAKDLDLYLYEIVSGGELEERAKSADVQNGSSGHTPIEVIEYMADSDDGSFCVRIDQASGTTPTWIQLVSWGGVLEYSTSVGSIGSPGESANSGMMAVGAAAWDSPAEIALYSSQGPTPDGRVKPDIVGADGGSTSSIDGAFRGTSQASPHIAGLAALVQHRYATYTPQQVVSYLKTNAAQRIIPSPNNIWGHGFAHLPEFPASCGTGHTLTGRTQKVVDAIVEATSGVTLCNNITATHLSAITSLDLSSENIVSLINGDFGGMTGLQTLDLRTNQLSSLPVNIFSGLSGLQTLNLGSNRLSALDENIFDGLSDLQTLDLSNNRLTQLDADIFDGLSSLQTLDLQHNQIASLPSNLFNGLSSLQTLNLNGNRMPNQPASYFQNQGLTSLQTLHLGEVSASATELMNYQAVLSALTTLQLEGACGSSPVDGRTRAVIDAIVAATDGVSACADITATHLAAITSLDLSNEGLTSLRDGDFAGLTGLQVLRLQHNRLSTLPTNIFDGLTSLSSLWLEWNRITGLHEDIFDGLSNLRTLHLHDNLIAELDADLFDGLSNLHRLWLGNNKLTGLDEDVFDGLSGLYSLHLYRNQITSLPSDVFSDTTNLQVLLLHNNRLSVLPADIFDGLSNLQILHLERNGLTVLDADLFDGLSSLRNLWLQYNQLSALDADIFDGLSNLRLVQLERNGLTALDADLFDGLSNLQILDLDYNNVSSLEADIFSGLTNLEILWIDGNELTILPANLLDGLSSLESLTFASNSISDLDADIFDDLSSLELLWLQNNELDSLPVGLFDGLSSMKTLRLYGNSLGNLPPRYFRGQSLTALSTLLMGRTEASASDLARYRAVLPSLTTLWLEGTCGDSPIDGRTPAVIDAIVGASSASNCRDFTERHLLEVTALDLSDKDLSSLHSVDFRGLVNLETLDLSNNGLSSLPFYLFYRLSSLMTLDLSHNQIDSSSLYGLYQAPNLENLDLSHNQIASLPDLIFYRLGSLRTLDLSHNQIESLSSRSLSGLANLRTLRLHGNRFNDIPPSSFSRSGLDALETLSIDSSRFQLADFRSVLPSLESLEIPDPTLILRIEPYVESVALVAGDKVRLVVNVFGLQGQQEDSLADEESVTFDWSIDGEGTLSESLSAGVDSNVELDGRRVFYTAPDSPGDYTVTASLDAPSECIGTDEECAASFKVTVIRKVALPVSPTPIVCNDSGEIPSALTDPDGNAYDVFSAVDGGSFVGDDAELSVQPGAVSDCGYIGIRVVNAGEAENPRKSLYRYTIDGDLYRVEVVDAQGALISDYSFEKPAQICIPLPESLTGSITDITALKINSNSSSLTALGTKIVTKRDSRPRVCGALSELPADVAVGKRGTPDHASAPVVTEFVVADIESPETGGVSMPYGWVVFGLLIGVVMSMLGLKALLFSLGRGEYRCAMVMRKG